MSSDGWLTLSMRVRLGADVNPSMLNPTNIANALALLLGEGALLDEIELYSTPSLASRLRSPVVECVAHGGHCWESAGVLLTSRPPQYPERCKHCPARRVGIPQPAMAYRDTTPVQT